MKSIERLAMEIKGKTGTDAERHLERYGVSADAAVAITSATVSIPRVLSNYDHAVVEGSIEIIARVIKSAVN
jgi:hypothetical protein